MYASFSSKNLAQEVAECADRAGLSILKRQKSAESLKMMSQIL
jgi:hypothetical protein